MKGEVKDIKLTNKGEERRHLSAQTGNVPIDKLKDMIKDYTGEDYDNNIPDKYIFKYQIIYQYWRDYLDIMNDKLKLKKTLGKLNITDWRFR